MNDYDLPANRNIFGHPGFQMGLVGGVLMILFHLILLVINQMENRGDLLAWIAQIILYVVIAQTAASKQYQQNQSNLFGEDQSSGIVAAAMGAAFMTSLWVWAFLLARALIADAVGIRILFNPVWVFCNVLLDIILAASIGTAVGNRMVANLRKLYNF